MEGDKISKIDRSRKIFFGIPLSQYYGDLLNCRLIAASENTVWPKIQSALESV
jgi:hypothetical protein